MAATKSKSPSKKGKDHSRNGPTENANEGPTNVATSKVSSNMADNNGMPSVIEFEDDLSNQEAPVPLPVGDYVGEIRGATQKTGQTSGKPYASVQFFIPADQYPADYTEGEPDGTVLSYNMVSLADTPNARFRLRRFVEAIGAPLGKKIDLNDWVGRSATLSIQHGTFDGLPKAEIGKVTAA
jgi:hypothetical protein